MDDVTARRAHSFSAVTTAYAQHQPGYPDEAVAWALGTRRQTGNVEDLVGWVAELTEAVQAKRSVAWGGDSRMCLIHPEFGGPEQRQFCWR
jgi:hypothetical protein